jgi:tyrosyl-tRNA synthetase
MNAMVPSLEGGKMSASNINSKIDFLDPPDVIRKKIKAAFCEEGNVAENPVLSFVLAVLIPISRLRLEREAKGGDHEEAAAGGGQYAIGDQRPFVGDDAPEGAVFTIKKGDKSGGGSTHYMSAEELKIDFAEKRIHPMDLKAAVIDAILRLLDPIRKAFEENEEWQNAHMLGYPDPNAKQEKKKKKVRIEQSNYRPF